MIARKICLSRPLTGIFLALALATSAVAAEGDPAVGVYFAAGDLDGLPIAVSVKIEAGGTINIVYNIGGTTLFGDSFAAEQGVWKRTKPREVAARVITFDYFNSNDAPPAGELVANTITGYVFTFAEDFDGFTATLGGTGYPPDTNPLRPGDAVPVFTFSGSLTGERVTVADGDDDSDDDSDD